MDARPTFLRLIDAAKTGDLGAAQRLLGEGADVDARLEPRSPGDGGNPARRWCCRQRTYGKWLDGLEQGCLRHEFFVGGEYRGALRMAMLQPDYLALRKKG